VHSRLLSALVLGVALTALTACGGDCPACPETAATPCPACPTCETTGATPPPDTGVCTEEWVHMPVLIIFPTGGAELDELNRRILRETVQLVGQNPRIRRVRVEGHTDSRGRESGNRALSTARADSVAAELVTMGVPRAMIETIGYGSERPLASDDPNHPEMVNRRVEFSLLVCQTR
jgi:OOP family OmpA-OmpF porin